MAAPGATEAGRRLRDMMDILRKRAPRLRPNTVPRSCWPFLDDPQLAAWAPASEGQRKALAAALAAERRRAGGQQGEEEEDGDGGVRLALVAEVDVDAGVCHIQSAKYVSEVEADLHSVARILNLHSRGESDELRLRLEHFLSVNHLPSDALRDTQEIYSLAYAITVCLGAAPTIRATAGPDRVPLPLAPSVDAGALVAKLFAAEAAGGGQKKKGKEKDSGNGATKKRKGWAQEEQENGEEEEEQAGAGAGQGKKRRRKQKKGNKGGK